MFGSIPFRAQNSTGPLRTCKMASIDAASMISPVLRTNCPFKKFMPRFPRAVAV